ncbi:uncharacterized protein LOC112601020 [Melanaphis sacchari]|uniref:uncharacterized protein LOC112601020 n=1 Tax=Melanaphis sacchari TaxID=742174 RepID=UPI000DC149A5|nr:uncharacterized protein LOC112601020 [Melanaphis sacchari]
MARILRLSISDLQLLHRYTSSLSLVELLKFISKHHHVQAFVIDCCRFGFDRCCFFSNHNLPTELRTGLHLPNVPLHLPSVLQSIHYFTSSMNTFSTNSEPI